MKANIKYYWNILLIWLGVRSAPILKNVEALPEFIRKVSKGKPITTTKTIKKGRKLFQHITYYKRVKIGAARNKAGEMIRAGFIALRPYGTKVIKHNL